MNGVTMVPVMLVDARGQDAGTIRVPYTEGLPELIVRRIEGVENYYKLVGTAGVYRQCQLVYYQRSE